MFTINYVKNKNKHILSTLDDMSKIVLSKFDTIFSTFFCMIVDQDLVVLDTPSDIPSFTLQTTSSGINFFSEKAKYINKCRYNRFK